MSVNTDDCPRRTRRKRPPRRKRRGDKNDDHDDDEIAYLLRVAWPVMHRSVETVPLGRLRAFAVSSPGIVAARDATNVVAAVAGTVALPGTLAPAGATAFPVPAVTLADHAGETLLSADLSGAVIREFNGRAPGILIKAVARAAVKYTIVNEIADDSEVAQVIGNVVAALLERADTRSWTLLPSDMHIVRLQLPAGTHQVLVELDSGGFATPPLILDDVEVFADRVTVVSARAWP